MVSVSTRSANEQANDLILVQTVQLNSTNLRMYSVRFSILCSGGCRGGSTSASEPPFLPE